MFTGKRAAHAGNRDKQSTEHQHQFAQAIDEKEASEAKLQNTLGIKTAITLRSTYSE